jgi:hypothetical protein
MRDAIARALAKDKEQRFANVNAFFEAFSTGGPGVPTTGPQPQRVSITPQGGGTAMINAPAQSGPNERMKTEMGAPAMAPMSMGPGMGGPAPNPYGPPPAQPQMVTASSQQEKKSPVLIIALGGLAALLLIGAGVAAAMSGHKTPSGTATSIDLSPSPAPAPAPAPENTLATAVTSATPLTAPVVAPHAAPKPAPAAAPSTKPAPKPDPPSCVDARKARTMKGINANTLAVLEKKCRDDGGSL